MYFKAAAMIVVLILFGWPFGTRARGRADQAIARRVALQPRAAWLEDGRDVPTLGFLGRARSVGFSIGQCPMLLPLCQNKARADADVEDLPERHIAKIREGMRL